jgi:beta-xylosidase
MNRPYASAVTSNAIRATYWAAPERAEIVGGAWRSPLGEAAAVHSSRRSLRGAAAISLVLAGGGLLGSCTPDSDGSDGAPASAPRSAASGSTPTPVIDQDFPDPDVLRVGGTYYAYATQNGSGSRNVQLATSPDLRSWTVSRTDPLPELPSWATNGRTWAPDVSAVGDGFVMYVTVHSVDPDVQCLGAARASSPTGPFRPVGHEPLVCPAAAGGAIDPASHVEPDGTRWLLWKNDGNCCGHDTWLHLQRLSADGLRTAGPARRLVKQDLPWEGGLVEAPTLVRHDGSYVLLYSANAYGGDAYATGYAVADRLTGPYRKADEPLLTSGATGITGPGGQDLVTGPDGTEHLVVHGWDPAIVYRGVYLLDVTWRDGRPVVQD